ncbi:sugar ABC transporter permease [Clostridiales bacterium COT073_COT-073]|nr:sugar ABC transporter permease [Clostridiales bacterium COT073_COT-073]
MKKKKTTFRSWLCKEHVAGYILAAPFIIGFLAFIIAPMSVSLYFSFCDYNILSPEKWVGLKNYIKLLSDPKLINSLKVTFKYAFFSVPLKLTFSLLVALLLLRNTKAAPFYRAVYYVPSIMGASVAVSVLWRQVFTTNGLFNQVTGFNFAWLAHTQTAIWVLILLSVWQFGSSMLIFSSALKQIPQEFYEAAKVDGAGKISSFFRITLPLLSSTIFFNLIMQSINGLLVFVQGQIITAGKPMDSTKFYVLYMYEQAFKFNNAGYASAMGWIMVLLIISFTAFLFITKKLWVYEGGY